MLDYLSVPRSCNVPTNPIGIGKTQVVGDFRGCLDYIWASPNMKALRILELTDLETPIPSEHYPSDHLAVGADLCLLSS